MSPRKPSPKPVRRSPRLIKEALPVRRSARVHDPFITELWSRIVRVERPRPALGLGINFGGVDVFGSRRSRVYRRKWEGHQQVVNFNGRQIVCLR